MSRLVMFVALVIAIAINAVGLSLGGWAAWINGFAIVVCLSAVVLIWRRI